MPEAPAPPPAPLRRLAVSTRLHGPGSAVGLADPFGLAPGSSGRTLLVDRADWELARRFDGARDAEALARDLTAELGRPVDAAAVRATERVLSERLLLEDAAARRAEAEAFERFRAAPARAAVGAGAEYPDDPFELRLRVGGLVADDWDMPELPHAQGLLAPGGALRPNAGLYSRAYAAVRHARGQLARVVLLGNVGAPLERLLVPLAKPFATPLGEVAADGEALAALAHLPGRDQLAHRDHRALERQVLFVRLLFPGVPVVPLLASALPVVLPDGAESPAGLDAVEEAVAGIERVLALEGRTLVVAATPLYRVVDGRLAEEDGEPARGALLAGEQGRRIRDTDREVLDGLIALDPERLWSAALADGDAVRAGLAVAPYLLARALAGRTSLKDGTPLAGSTLGYLQLPTPGAIETAAAVVFH